MYGTPANVDDGLGPRFARAWQKWMHDTTCDAVAWARAEMDIQGEGAGALGYVDLDGAAAPAGAREAPAPWSAFPLRIRARHDGVAGPAAWREAERLAVATREAPVYDAEGNVLPLKRRLEQDEYLEWFGDRVTDPDGEGLARVHVTCEGPEYWQRLAAFGATGRTRVHSLYESLLGRPVPIDDLFYPAGAHALRDGRQVAVGGEYNPLNTWNTDRGAIHLTHPANTLGAEVNLAVRAAIPRRGHTTPANDTTGLTVCGGFGNPSRDSDPHIGAAANSFVRNGYQISLANPIGLYISDLTATTLRLPDGSAARPGRAELPAGASSRLEDWWSVVRPSDPGLSPSRRILRAVFEPPPNSIYVKDGLRRPLRVSDLYVRDDRITHAGALATEVQMQLFVLAWKPAGRPAPAELGCYDDAWGDEIARRASAACRPQAVAVRDMERTSPLGFATSRA